MKQEIVRFLIKACKKWKCSANWTPGFGGGVYFVHLNGRAIQTFTLMDFYQLPKKYRFAMYEPLIKKGLAHNLGEKTKDGLYGSYKLGKKIY